MDAATAKALMIVHAISAGVFVGSATHAAMRLHGAGAATRGRRHVVHALAAWGLTVAIGAWIYPAYRVAVRAAWLDPHARWASILFDVKENAAVFCGPLLLVALAGAGRTPLHRACACLAAGIGWFAMVSGLLTVSMRSL